MGHLFLLLQMSGRSRRHLQTPLDGSRGRSNTKPLCWECLWNVEELMEWYVFNFFSLSTIDPDHIVQ